jgi:putative flavoprotein involved in K+ transport
VIGAGPAGLATSRALQARGIDHVVLERGDTVGHTWANLYDSLVLHTGKHLSALPGLRFPRSTPLFPTRRQFLDYLQRYRDIFRLPVRTGIEVTALDRANAHWRVRTTAGEIESATVIVATGIVGNPHEPAFPGRERFGGRVVHSVSYRRPEPFHSQRVLVVGAGNSAGEIGAELAAAGVRVSLAVRSGALAVPREMAGIPIQYVAYLMFKLPPPARRRVLALMARIGEWRRGPSPFPKPRPSDCPDIPLIGFHITDAIRQGLVELRPGVAEFTADGVRFADGSTGAFDVVMLATGFLAAVRFLDGVVRLDHCGFAQRTDRVTSADHPGLFFVGHNYDTRGGLVNISQDSRLAARAVARRAC